MTAAVVFADRAAPCLVHDEAAAKRRPVPRTIDAVIAEPKLLLRGAEKPAAKSTEAYAPASAAGRRARIARRRALAAEAEASAAHPQLVARVTGQFRGDSFGAAGAQLTSSGWQRRLNHGPAAYFMSD